MATHVRWVADYNVQRHFAHEQREDGRRSPVEVLSFLTGIRYHLEDLQRAFFSTRYVRVLDSLGYARLMHWRVYGEEALAAREAALWLDEENLTVEYQGKRSPVMRSRCRQRPASSRRLALRYYSRPLTGERN